MQRKTHSDAGGTDGDFQEVREAIAEGLIEWGANRL